MAIERVNGSENFNRPERLEEASSPAERDAHAAAPGDRIELGSDPRRVARLVDRARALPEIRRARVEALRQQLAAGTHQVDPRRVARALLEFEDGLGG